MKRKRIKPHKPKKKAVVRPPLPEAAWAPPAPDLLYGIPDDLWLLGDDDWDDDPEWDEDGNYILVPPDEELDRERRRAERDEASTILGGFWADEYADYGSRGYRAAWNGLGGFGLGLGYNNLPSPDEFVRQGREWAGRTAPECSSAPFYAGTYGYSLMDERQQQWFFYWRSQVRAGTFPRTPGDYVNLLAYEVLNGIGVDSPEAGLSLLVGLDQAYSKTHRLGYQFDVWLDDYAVVHKLVDRIGGIRRARGLAEKGPQFSNIAIDARAADPMGKMPAAMIAQIGGARIEMGAFARADNEKLLADVVQRAVGAVDAELQRSGAGLIDRWTPKGARLKRRWAYEGALVAGKRRRVEVRLPTDYATAHDLVGVVRGLIEHTENRVRAATGCTRMLPADGVDPAHAALIDRVILEALPELTRKHKGKKGYAALSSPPVVRVDSERVDKLREESDAVRGMLIEAMGTEEVPADAKAVLPSMAAISALTRAEAPRALSEPERLVIAALLDGEEVEATVRTIAEKSGMMPAVLLDGINEMSVGIVGDAVIDVSGAAPAIYEEYREDLAAWVGR